MEQLQVLSKRDLAKVEHLASGRESFLLTKEITPEIHDQFLIDLGKKERDSRVKQIYIYIDCIGGGLWESLIMAEQLRRLNKPVNTVVVGRAYSGAALVAAAGTPGMRYAWDNTEFMLHELSLEQDANYNINEWRRLMAAIERENDRWIRTFSSLTNQTPEKIKIDAKDGLDYYIATAEEAKAYGIIDHIIPRRR